MLHLICLAASLGNFRERELILEADLKPFDMDAEVRGAIADSQAMPNHPCQPWYGALLKRTRPVTNQLIRRTKTTSYDIHPETQAKTHP